jgi:hypothetical protein
MYVMVDAYTHLLVTMVRSAVHSSTTVVTYASVAA